jgi:hypothetical protein
MWHNLVYYRAQKHQRLSIELELLSENLYKKVCCAFRPLGFPDEYIFLSYESDDKPLINKVADILTNAGGNVWTDDMIDNHEETEYI